MTRAQRALVVATLLAIVGAPLAAFHPALPHLFDAGQPQIPSPLADAAVVAVFMLVGASLLPLAGLARISAKWVRGSSDLRTLSESGNRRHTEDEIEFVLLPAPEVIFFTAGILRPRIYATAGAVNSLTPDAFRAGLLHERAHQRRRDVAWRAALAAIERAFSPFPAVRAAVRSLALDCEFAADRAALAAGARRADLFDAMVATSRRVTPSPATGLAAEGLIPRLTALADPSAAQPQPKLTALIVALTALALVPVMVHALFWLGAVCL